MVRTEKRVLIEKVASFFDVVAILDLEELDGFTPRDSILLIQDFDWVPREQQVSLERCHFWQHNVHGCVQTFLQL
jgi:hypothetical protein